MKNIKILILISLITLVSCNKVLDVVPQTAIPDSDAFSTSDRVGLAVVGVYGFASSGFYNLPNQALVVRGYPFGAAHVEQGDCRGEDALNTQAFYAVTYESTYDPTTANNDYMWQTLWALINKSNVVIQGLLAVTPSSSLTQSAIDAYLGECYFLRALSYHELLKHFCRPYSDNPTGAASGVPLRLTPIRTVTDADAESKRARNTIAECYDQIIKDLDNAEKGLPATRAASVALTRATKAAAIALKTRVYLHKGDWASVISEGNKLVPTSAPFSSSIGGYKLTDDPYGPFGSGNKSNTESIFSIENSATANPGTNGALPAMYSASIKGGRGLVGISPILWNQPWFLSTDKRKSSTFTETDTGSSGKNAKFSKKYTDITARSDNAPIIRYAEVLLNLAEAIQRQSSTPDARAFALLNAVRSRSVTDPATDQLSDFATNDALTQAILNERRIEFVCEGLRWGDIHRLLKDTKFGTGGIPAKCSRNITDYASLYTGSSSTSFAVHAFIPYGDKRILWPIPSSETSVNPTLANQQNPGY